MLNIRFSDITLNKAAAIARFLWERSGVESFIFCPPPPFAKNKIFKCKVWNITDSFYDNYTIDAEFEEVGA